jgi:S-methylmethionine-dependent homocysteine/selenocysteine methylase
MSNIKILDGGMGRELLRIGAPFQQPEWSALALVEAPNMVTQAHQNFIDAGVQIITTNTYALVPFHIGHNQDVPHLANIAVQCAKDAAKNSDVQIAGCIPPAFGSYKPELFIPDMVDPILTPLIQAQKDHVDYWLIETLSSVHEAQTVINLIKHYSNLPIWASFTLNNRTDFSCAPTLRSGEAVDSIKPIIHDVDAILFNCSQPEEMEDAIRITRSLSSDIQIGAYANNFSEIKRTKNANEGLSEGRDDITPEIYLEFAKTWVDVGATIIGGCCGITPDHIKHLANNLK